MDMGMSGASYSRITSEAQIARGHLHLHNLSEEEATLGLEDYLLYKAGLVWNKPEPNKKGAKC
jgi:hypothetical protein